MGEYVKAGDVIQYEGSESIGAFGDPALEAQIHQKITHQVENGKSAPFQVETTDG